MTRWPPFLGPGWLVAYAIGGVLWMLLIEFTPLPFVLTVAALGLLGAYQLGSWLMGGEPPRNKP